MPHTSLAAIVWGSKKTHGLRWCHGLVFSRMFFDSIIWLHVDSYGFWRKRHRLINVLTKKRACSKSVESSYNQLMNQWDKLKKSVKRPIRVLRAIRVFFDCCTPIAAGDVCFMSCPHYELAKLLLWIMNCSGGVVERDARPPIFSNGNGFRSALPLALARTSIIL